MNKAIKTKSSTESKTDWRFIGDQKVPSRVCYLLQQREVNSTDLLISFVVNALIRSPKSQGKGCYMPIAAMGIAVGTHPINVSKSIHKMVEMGLMLCFYCDGIRYLEMEWSRIEERGEH